jgi:hypothetical protein
MTGSVTYYTFSAIVHVIISSVSTYLPTKSKIGYNRLTLSPSSRQTLIQGLVIIKRRGAEGGVKGFQDRMGSLNMHIQGMENPVPRQMNHQ